jgi:hypothetical protein
MHSESNHPYRAESPVDKASHWDEPRRRHFTDLAAALADAQQRANEIEISQPILDFLYGKTRWRSLKRTEWERQVRVATAFDENLTRFGSAPLLKRIANQIAVPLKANVVPELTSAPTLAIAYHGGFSVTIRRLFAYSFPDSVIIGANGRYAAREGAFALFAAREALLEAKSVLMAPDGRFGKEAATISVLGAQLPVTDGAPFLGHATGCNVMWIALTWTGHGFTIEVVAGPRRVAGEPFADYRLRFYRFYADQLEQAFTGDPANLPLTKNWEFIFSAMLAGKIHRFRHRTR